MDIYTFDVECTECGTSSLVCIELHSSKRLSWKTEGFVISHSKLGPYQDDLLCVHVVNSSLNGFSSWFTTK